MFISLFVKMEKNHSFRNLFVANGPRVCLVPVFILKSCYEEIKYKLSSYLSYGAYNEALSISAVMQRFYSAFLFWFVEMLKRPLKLFGKNTLSLGFFDIDCIPSIYFCDIMMFPATSGVVLSFNFDT